MERDLADGKLESRMILGTRVDVSCYGDAVSRITRLIEREEYGYVCVANVHMIMEAYDDVSFRNVVNGAKFVTSDGMPLVWGLRFQGSQHAQRVYGPVLTPMLCREAATRGMPVGFYGGTKTVLDKMGEYLTKQYPSLKIVYSFSPPFRPLTPEEDASVLSEILLSDVKILFVGLGCPKQERWMATHADRINGVQIGVGAAFNFIAGNKRQAPMWMQQISLEWLFRLATEPRRLWKRYLFHNPRFLIKFAAQLVRQRFSRKI